MVNSFMTFSHVNALAMFIGTSHVKLTWEYTHMCVHVYACEVYKGICVHICTNLISLLLSLYYIEGD